MENGNKNDGTNDNTIQMTEGIHSNVEVSEGHMLSDHIFDRQETYTYVNHNVSVERPYDGPSYLVGRAISNTNHFDVKMNENDVMLQTKL